jgi:PAS domain S-box-containing protein
MRIVARPVRRAVAVFRRLSSGDYVTPVLTRRTDEFGDMLRALDGMRQSLGTAVRARNDAERRYREIVERSVEGFYQTTITGDLLAGNDALAHMLGYESAAVLLAEPPGIAKRVYVDPTRRAEYIRLLTESGSVTGYESALRRLDGRVFWVSQSARLVRDDYGVPLYLEGFLVDITARKEAEQLKADFVGFVTHQLRTPLTGIRWMLELARNEDITPSVESYLGDAQASAERLISLVNDLLDITRLESGRVPVDPHMLDLRALVAEVVDELALLAEAKSQRLQANGDRKVTAYADPQLTRQAVINLIGNAIKYTPNGGEVEVTTRSAGPQVTCAIRDTGIGIPAGAQARLFEKFYRADNAASIDTEGTGLGLYLVKLIVERSGGTITCESEEQRGSTFVLSLPAGTHKRAIA